MARMVATKAALSIRVDALSDADSKSSTSAASIGIENRAKLESRLRALEYRSDLTTNKAFSGERRKSQAKFEMKATGGGYNTAADLVPTQRQDPEAIAVQAVLEVKSEKQKEKEERRKAKEEKKRRKSEAAATADVTMEDAAAVEGALVYSCHSG